MLVVTLFIIIIFIMFLCVGVCVCVSVLKFGNGLKVNAGKQMNFKISVRKQHVM